MFLIRIYNSLTGVLFARNILAENANDANDYG